MPLFIPSPADSVWHLGPLPLRAYALCIIVGAILAIWIGERRWAKNGGQAGFISDLALFAVPAGIVGARLYHVLTDPQLYFGEGKDPIAVLYIWEGGLGIWGGIAGGALAVWLVCRWKKESFLAVADALAPGLLVAQAVGRFGNWFNQELFGKPTELPWALEIDAAHRPAGYSQFETFHPTFLYEALWNIAGAAFLIWFVSKRVKFGQGRVFAAYVMVYTAGRFWIEQLRIDPVNDFDGIRLNVVTSLVVFVIGAYFFWQLKHRRPAVMASHGDEDESAG